MLLAVDFYFLFSSLPPSFFFHRFPFLLDKTVFYWKICWEFLSLYWLLTFFIFLCIHENNFWVGKKVLFFFFFTHNILWKPQQTFWPIKYIFSLSFNELCRLIFQVLNHPWIFGIEPYWSLFYILILCHHWYSFSLLLDCIH